MYDNDEGMTRAQYKEHLKLLLQEKLEDLAIDLNVPSVEPIKAPAKGNLCSAYWGQEWCRHLQTYAHWEHRLERGRSLLRKGCVYAVSVEKGYASAYVATDDLYKVEVSVEPVDEDLWAELTILAQQNPFSLLDLWEGKLSSAVMEALTLSDHSIFPRDQEIRLSCGCMDWADLCEHGGALLYALGIYFESNPRALFEWRGLSPDVLIQNLDRNFRNSASTEHEILEDEIASIFGIDVSNK